MIENSRTIKVRKQTIFFKVYLPQGSPKAIIQINHGLAEHSGRYGDFARYLCQKGYAVYIHDHPGHGQSVKNDEQPGHLEWKSGWKQLLRSTDQINKLIRNEFPRCPVFIMGHSMGSLVARHYNAAYPMYFKGMILSGTTQPGSWELSTNLMVVKLLRVFFPSKMKIGWVNRKFYNHFNTTLKNPRTPFDWLSSDPLEVDKYINDPLCGFDLSLGFFKNLLTGALVLKKEEKSLSFRKNFPILILSGLKDSVGNMGKQPRAVFKNYIKQGYFKTQLELKDGRHELLNESNRYRNYQIIEDWLNKNL